jgi:hypothetical protein
MEAETWAQLVLRISENLLRPCSVSTSIYGLFQLTVVMPNLKHLRVSEGSFGSNGELIVP